MKTLYYNCFAGISGDMNLAAMIDLGVPAEYLVQELKKLHIEGYSINVSRKHKNDIYGTQVRVLTDHCHKDDNHHDSGHHHNHNHNHHQHPHNNLNPHAGDCRNFDDIKSIIENSGLNSNIKDISLRIFKKIAAAEAIVHNRSVDDVHFHEVGAVDSIIDIVGAAICYDYLKPEKVMCSTIELGGGFINCAHGKIPVPAPATVEILKNVPVKTGGVNAETTTPTGAAILTTLVDEYSDKLNLEIEKVGYGLGHRDMEIPNMLRVYACKSESRAFQTAKTKIAECNIDDMSPEISGYLLEKLLDMGAEDVFFTPIYMKKSRPAIKLQAIYNENMEDAILDVLFRESTTIGVRTFAVEKHMLERRKEMIETDYGQISIKSAYWKNKRLKFKPEFEDCKRAARKHKLSVREVIDEVNYIVRKGGK